MTSLAMLPNHPLSAKEISAMAQGFEFNHNIPLKAWIRTAQTLYQEAEIYMGEGNVGQSYLLFLRYTILVLEYLNKHPDARTPEGKTALRSVNKSLKASMAHLERLKPIIQRDYEEWEAAEAKRRDHRKKQQADRPRSKASPTFEEHISSDPALTSTSRLLDAGEHQELAVDLAKREIQRREAARRAGPSQADEQNRRIAGLWDDWAEKLAERQADDEETFQKHMAMTKRRLDGHEDGQINNQEDELQAVAAANARSSKYRYPSILKPESVPYEPLPPPPPKREPSPQPQPPRPPKEYLPRFKNKESYFQPPLVPERPTPQPFLPGRPTPQPSAPERPAKEQIYPENTLPTPERSQELPTPPPKVHDEPPAPPKRPQRLTFQPAAYLENGEPIRSMFLPRSLRDRFRSIASENTRKELELCGILCGTAVNNALFVRCLLIPEQICTSQTCETKKEENMFEYCLSEDLLVLGWIHTHPTQECFMSSLDCHTHSGYQRMMAESIAIVCSEKTGEHGIFRLTHPPGLAHVLECEQKTAFHLHEIDNIYTDCRNPPGHVFESDELDFYVHDLRPGARNNSNSIQHKNY